MKEHSEPSKEETKTDNELIAEFMGWKAAGTVRQPWFWSKERPYYKHDNHKVQPFPEGFEYDTSWDRLMPVVRKIIQLTSATNIGLIDIKHRLEAVKKTGVIQNNLKFADINSVYSSVVGFIQWYNTQQHERK